MKKYVVILGLLLTCNAYAENWKRYAVSDDGEFFVDKDSINKVDGFIYSWTKLKKYHMNDGYNLAMVAFKTDCFRSRSTRISATLFVDKNVVFSHTEVTENWEYAYPGSIKDYLIKEVCKK